jgi:hypothetical protein
MNLTEQRRLAQLAAHEANRQRAVTLTCSVCGGSFVTTGDRQSARTCGPACKKARLKQRHSHWTKRTKEQRQAERRRIAASKGKSYRPRTHRTAEERAESLKRFCRQCGVQIPKGCQLCPEHRRRGDPEYDRLRAARKYALNTDRERARVLDYKRRHPDKNRDWGHRRRARIAGGYVETVNVSALLAERKTCLYCGVRLTADTATMDHLIAINRGGRTRQST